MPVEKRFLNVKVQMYKPGRRLRTVVVAEAIRQFFVPSDWELLSSQVGIRAGHTAVITMTVQKYQEREAPLVTPIIGDDEADFTSLFVRWATAMGVEIREWDLRAVESIPAESDSVPIYGGKFGREGLSD